MGKSEGVGLLIVGDEVEAQFKEIVLDQEFLLRITVTESCQELLCAYGLFKT